MRRTLWLLPLLSCLAWAAPADAAAILYNTTDLGSGFSLQKNADGSIYGITNGAGTTTYAFSKVPVTPIDVQLPAQPLIGDISDQAQAHLTMQVGPYRVGTSVVSTSPLGTLIVPSFETPTGLQYALSPSDLSNAWIGANQSDTVRDLNVLGQAVGVGLLHPGQSRDTYAAFSAPGLVGHGGYSPTVDNLNNYIAEPPGVTLDTAVKIDDLGRILAAGTDAQGVSHSYLLTPVALGEAATVPEPTSLATLGALGVALCARARSRRRRANRAGPGGKGDTGGKGGKGDILLFE